MLLGIVVVILLKGGYVCFGSMLACTLFGFTLAETGAAPAINSALTSIAGALSSF